MALQECRLNLNQKLKELRPHGTLEFPCAGYSSYYTGRQEDSIPWHWHEEIEMVYVAEGRLELKIPSESFYVETGDAFVINSNVLHYAIAADYCKLHSLVFHPTLILGNEDSVFAKKYVRPLVSCHAFSGCAVSRFENAHVIQKNLKMSWRYRRHFKVRTICGYEKCWSISRDIILMILSWRILRRRQTSEKENVCAVFRRQYSFRPSSMF